MRDISCHHIYTDKHIGCRGNDAEHSLVKINRIDMIGLNDATIAACKRLKFDFRIKPAMESTKQTLHTVHTEFQIKIGVFVYDFIPLSRFTPVFAVYVRQGENGLCSVIDRNVRGSRAPNDLTQFYQHKTIPKSLNFFWFTNSICFIERTPLPLLNCCIISVVRIQHPLTYTKRLSNWNH